MSAAAWFAVVCWSVAAVVVVASIVWSRKVYDESEEALAVRCVYCRQSFFPAKTDERTRAEQHRLFPGVPDSERAIVCNECARILKFEGTNHDRT